MFYKDIESYIEIEGQNFKVNIDCDHTPEEKTTFYSDCYTEKFEFTAIFLEISGGESREDREIIDLNNQAYCWLLTPCFVETLEEIVNAHILKESTPDYDIEAAA